MYVVRCPRCGAGFADPSGQYAAYARLAGDGRIGLMVGCTACQLLFVPAAGVAQPTLELPSRYQIVRELGRGGMGTTLLAIDRETGCHVCIKRLHAGVDDAHLRQEWRALAAISHPSIVRYLDRYEDAGAPHLVMEYVDGVSLDRVLAAGPLLETPALDVALQLCEALATVHAHGVIHRDVKPANILVGWHGARLVPRLVDFGLAIVDDFDAHMAVTAMMHIAGTPAYMAPEQGLGAMLSAAVDVYAVGATLAELLAGQVDPAGAVTRMQQWLQSDGIALDAPSSAPTRQLLRDLTRRAPEARPSAAEAAARIRALLPRLTGPELVAPCFALATDAGWFDGIGMVEAVSDRYIRAVAAGTLTSTAPAAAPRELFATAMQRVCARDVAGHAVELTAELATEGAHSASLWLRADDAAGRQLAFDNMSDRALRGTTAFTRVGLTLRVPPQAAWLGLGILHVGGGRVSARRLALRRADGVRVALELEPAETLVMA